MEDYILKHSGEEIDEFIYKFAEIESDIDEIRAGADKGKTSVQGVKLNGSTTTRKNENGIIDLGNTYVTTLVYKATSIVENTKYSWNDSTFGAPIIKHEFYRDTGVIYFRGMITTIGNGAFSASSLKSITIPEGVTTIGDNAFEYCSSLTSVTITDSVTTIGNYAFISCSSLTSITIPDSVTTIGEGAFRNCTMLEKVVIGSSVRYIYDYAFRHCPVLKDISIKATNPPLLSPESLNEIGTSPIFYVPTESVETYKRARGWNAYADSIVGYHYNVGLFKTINGESIVGDGNIVIEKMTNISWSDLVRTRNNGELAPGTYYRIIDYVTTTTQENTSSAGNLFDVIVLALDKHTLSEEAYAIQSERDADGYFANSNLSAWKLWYCLDNDTTRFAWADETDGTGVIYRMVDEFENDCPYDFKNILFTRYELEAPSEYNAIGDDDKFVEQLSRNVRAMFDNDVASYRWAGVELGNKSWGGEPDRCYSETTENRHLFYTFSDITYYEGDIRALDASLSSSCNRNKIGARSYEYIMMLPNNVFLGNACNNNTFGDGCYNNTFGYNCYYNTFDDGCWDNTFGDECINNTFGNGSSNNAFGNWCNYNTFSYNCYNNTFGDGCYNNTFGNESSNNAFDSWCNNNTFSYNCCYNTFGDGCCYNTFGDECINNTFGGGCYNNTFGNGCNYNTFVYDFYVGNTFGNWVEYIHITYDGEPEAATYLQNYHIADYVRGASEEPLVINAERSREYETTIAKNSNGEIVEFCLADFPSLIVKTLNTPV